LGKGADVFLRWSEKVNLLLIGTQVLGGKKNEGKKFDPFVNCTNHSAITTGKPHAATAKLTRKLATFGATIRL
jgi:hypothetical protein